MHLRLPISLLAAATLLLTAPTSASGPTFWTVATSADFLAGRSEGAFVSLAGVVTPGPTLTSRLTSGAPQVWALAVAPDGSLLAGTGGDGRVVRLRTGQPDAVVYDAPESNVFALAVSGARTFAATGPDGHVRVIESDGTSRVFFDPEEKYIWALSMGRDGQLWVGAGNPAVVYRVDAAGAGQIAYRPPAAHVVGLTIDGAGRVLAATESPGRLYRLEVDGRAFALLDSGLGEVRAVAEGEDGNLYVAAVSREAGGSSAEPAAVTIAQTAPAPSGPPAEIPTGRSQVFRIAPDGTWESIWSTSDVVYDVTPAPEGGVFVATGPDGRLYRLGSGRDVSLLTGVDAGQITQFARPVSAGRLVAFATANPGRVYSVGDRPQSPATYLSRVLDTKTVATWGLVRFESTGAVTLSTRSGNTSRPDDSWSTWSAPSTAGAGFIAVSPPARFLQWRAVLSSPDGAAAPSLSAVTVAYLPRNSRPVVSAITTHPPGVVFQRPFANEDGAIAGLDDLTAANRRPTGDPGPPSPSPGRRMFQRGLQTITWKAEDGDSDRLTFTLRTRRDGDMEWRALRSDLLETIYVWDTTAVPDGRYVVRVEAHDSLSNTEGRALTGTAESAAVIVDNTAPAIAATVATRAGASVVAIEARDAMSAIQRVEYSIGGGPWQVVYPADGLADALVERYEVTLPAGTGASDVLIRATDAHQNVASAPAVR